MQDVASGEAKRRASVMPQCSKNRPRQRLVSAQITNKPMEERYLKVYSVDSDDEEGHPKVTWVSTDFQEDNIIPYDEEDTPEIQEVAETSGAQILDYLNTHGVIGSDVPEKEKEFVDVIEISNTYHTAMEDI